MPRLEPHVHGDANLPRVALANIERGRKIRWFISKVKTTYCILCVEQVSRKKLRRPAFGFVAQSAIGQCVGVGLLVVTDIKVKGVFCGQIQPGEQAARVPVYSAGSEGIARCVCLIASAKVNQRGRKLIEPGSQQTNAGVEFQRIARQPAQVCFEAVSAYGRLGPRR